MKPRLKIKTMALNRPVSPWTWLLIGFAVLSLLAGLSACAPAAPAAAPAGAPIAEALPKEVSIDEAVKLRDQGAFVLDVRTQEEWNDVHIPDATLIPLNELQSRLSEVPKDEDVLVVCRSGNRSASARDLLLQAGYPSVTSMAGGVTQWQAQGLPTVSGPQR